MRKLLKLIIYLLSISSAFKSGLLISIIGLWAILMKGEQESRERRYGRVRYR